MIADDKKRMREALESVRIALEGGSYRPARMFINAHGGNDTELIGSAVLAEAAKLALQPRVYA